MNEEFNAVFISIVLLQKKNNVKKGLYRLGKYIYTQYIIRERKVKTLTVISSIIGKSFHFPFPYFVLFVLRYFPFQVVNISL
jgi:hypothetical protein